MLHALTFFDDNLSQGLATEFHLSRPLEICRRAFKCRRSNVEPTTHLAHTGSGLGTFRMQDLIQRSGAAGGAAVPPVPLQSDATINGQDRGRLPPLVAFFFGRERINGRSELLLNGIDSQLQSLLKHDRPQRGRRIAYGLLAARNQLPRRGRIDRLRDTLQSGINLSQ